jgi:ATP-binding cassette subfamily F protein 3
MAVWNNPHILIMDEPTNHLDIDAVNALIAALNEFKVNFFFIYKYHITGCFNHCVT